MGTEMGGEEDLGVQVAEGSAVCDTPPVYTWQPL